jgi:hypothetical protein
VAEYAIANKIHEDPAFAWWVPFTLKKRNRILQKSRASIGSKPKRKVLRYQKVSNML